MVQWLRRHSLSAESTGLIPSQGTKILHAKRHDREKKKKKKKRSLYLNFYTFATLVLVWLHSNPLLLFSACAYFQLLQFHLVSICHFPPLCLGSNDSLMGISHNPSLSLSPSLFFPLSIRSLFFLAFFFECLFHRSAPTSPFFLILFGAFAYSSVSFHISYSYFSSSYQSLPCSSCLCVVHCSCLCFVFLPVSNSTYCMLFLSMNLSIDWFLYLLFCFSASLTNPHLSLSLFFGHTMQHLGSLLPNQGSNSCPLYWKCRILTNGL